MRNLEGTGAGRNRRSPWPWIIVGMLLTHVVIMVVAMMIAVHDKSSAIVPNYYERAVNWDAEQAKYRASEKLGWHVEMEAAEQVDPLGRRVVRFILTDAHGRAIPSAVIDLEYFHDAHGNEDRTVTLKSDSTDPRYFTALLPMRYAGEWELHYTITAGKQSFIGKQQAYVNNARRAS